MILCGFILIKAWGVLCMFYNTYVTYTLQIELDRLKAEFAKERQLFQTKIAAADVAVKSHQVLCNFYYCMPCVECISMPCLECL